MALTPEQVKKIAHLARLSAPDENIDFYANQLSRILEFIEQMNKVDTTKIEPLAHPLEISQRLRPDVVTESDLSKKYQENAPLVEAGFYLVPKVIDEA